MNIFKESLGYISVSLLILLVGLYSKSLLGLISHTNILTCGCILVIVWFNKNNHNFERSRIKKTSLSGFRLLRITALTLAISYFSLYFFSGSSLSSFASQMIYSEKLDVTLGGYILAGISLLVYPIGEGLFFRKQLLDSMSRHTINPVVLALISSLCSGILHAGQIHAMVAAFVLVLVYIKTGRVKYTIIIHILLNVMTYGMAYMMRLSVGLKESFFVHLPSSDTYTFTIAFVVALMTIIILTLGSIIKDGVTIPYVQKK